MPLSDVVSQLVRAQMGASVSSRVSDSELDKHVADLLLAEARQRESVASSSSYSYTSDTGTSTTMAKRKPNKRFLNNMLRNVDEHNQALLKAEEEAQRRRDEQEIERVRQWRRENHIPDHDHHQHRTRDNDYERPYKRRRDDSHDDDRHHRRHHSDRSSRRRVHHEDDSREKKSSRHRHSSPSSSSAKSKRSSSSTHDAPLPSVPPPPIPSDPLPSKMDKYFSKSYDPALDVAIPDMTRPDGTIAEGAFDEWNDMLETIRVRKQDKEERKRKETRDPHRHHHDETSKSKAKSKVNSKDEEKEEDDYERNVQAGLKAMGAYVRPQRVWDQGKKISDLA